MMSPVLKADTEGMSLCPSGSLTPPYSSAGAEPHWSARFIHWFVEARSHRVICLVLGVWVLNGFDLAFTILSHQQGMLQEANPFARHMLSSGTASIILYKIGLVMIGSYPLLRFRIARITEMGALVILCAYVLLAVHWSICYDHYAATINHSTDITELANFNYQSP